MTNTNHTPGPWSYGRSVSYIKAANGEVIGQYYGLGADRKTEHFANARLIAAAPELLEALKIANSILITEARDSIYNAGKSKIRAAIAKAEG